MGSQLRQAPGCQFTTGPHMDGWSGWTTPRPRTTFAHRVKPLSSLSSAGDHKGGEFRRLVSEETLTDQVWRPGVLEVEEKRGALCLEQCLEQAVHAAHLDYAVPLLHHHQHQAAYHPPGGPCLPASHSAACYTDSRSHPSAFSARIGCCHELLGEAQQAAGVEAGAEQMVVVAGTC